MKPWLTIRMFGIAFLLSSISLALSAADQTEPSTFTPPGINYASSIPYPIEGAAGMVGLSVGLDSSARVENMQVLRGIPSLTDSTLVAVKGWAFAPANADGHPSAANLPVNIVFNPRDSVSQSIRLPSPEFQVLADEASWFMPPQVETAWYAAYPEHTNFSGTLVLGITVNEAGQVSQVTIVRSLVDSFTQPVVEAVKKWSFKAGTLDGNPIPSHLIVAFVFHRSAIPSN